MIYQTFFTCGGLSFSFNRYYIVFLTMSAYGRLWWASFLLLLRTHTIFKKFPPVAAYCKITTLCVEKVHPPGNFAPPLRFCPGSGLVIKLTATHYLTYSIQLTNTHFITNTATLVYKLLSHSDQWDNRFKLLTTMMLFWIFYLIS